MINLVEADWVAVRIEADDALVLDPRGWMKYLVGHLQGAVHVKADKLFGGDGRLLTPDALAALFAAAGLSNSTVPIIYDSYDGQRGALLAWALEYLGVSDVYLLDTFFEGWKEQGRGVFYRPVVPHAAEFAASVNPGVRAGIDDVRDRGAAQLLDVRTHEEYSGQLEADPRPGHIPGARHVMWREFVGQDESYLAAEQQARDTLASAGISDGEPVIAYCRSGMRAALGYLALQQLGLQVRLYDGSYAEWSATDLPVEL